MILVLLILNIVIFIGSIIGILKKPEEEVDKDIDADIMFISLCVIILILVVSGGLISNVIDAYNIDDKIAMYEEQNEQIESQLKATIESYENYESETYKNTKINTENTDIIALAQTFPELKANELVKTQIQVHIDNNNKIKELQEKKIDARKDKWWLCFSTKID